MIHVYKMETFSLGAHGTEENIRPGSSYLSSSISFIISTWVILGTWHHFLYFKTHKVKVGQDQWFWNFTQLCISIFQRAISRAPKKGKSRVWEDYNALLLAGLYVGPFFVGFFKRKCLEARNSKISKLMS